MIEEPDLEPSAAALVDALSDVIDDDKTDEVAVDEAPCEPVADDAVVAEKAEVTAVEVPKLPDVPVALPRRWPPKERRTEARLAGPRQGSRETGPSEWRERLRHDRKTQAIAIATLAAPLVCLLFAVRGPTAAEKEIESPAFEAPVFPKAEVEGRKEAVDTSEVDELIAKETRRMQAANQASAPKDGPPIVLKPGQMVDPDTGAIEAVSEVPRVPEQRASRGTSVGQRVQYFTPGGTLEGVGRTTAAGKKSDRDLGLSVGDRINAKLLIGVSSTNHQVVLAQVLRDVAAGPVLRKGDVLVGQARNDDARIYLDFTKARTAAGERTFRGYAVERDMPGLVARRRESSFEDRSKSGALRGAVGAAGEIVGELAGASPAGAVARGVTGGIAPEAEHAIENDARVVLEVSAGKAFEIVVVEGAGS